jgi:hypothetical protein
MTFVAGHGHACLHPFNALPYDYFEGSKIGRRKTLEWCCRLIDACDEVWLFGISAGTLFEVEYLLDLESPPRLRTFVRDFDPDGPAYCSKYATEFPRGIAVVSAGASADLMPASADSLLSNRSV